MSVNLSCASVINYYEYEYIFYELVLFRSHLFAPVRLLCVMNENISYVIYGPIY